MDRFEARSIENVPGQNPWFIHDFLTNAFWIGRLQDLKGYPNQASAEARAKELNAQRISTDFRYYVEQARASRVQ